MPRIKLMYKIHGMRTANGVQQSAGNAVFYEMLDEALTAARSYVRQNGCNDSIVIYKAHVLVRKQQAPVEVMTISHGGEVISLR